MKKQIKKTLFLLSFITVSFLVTSCAKKIDDHNEDYIEDEPIVSTTFLTTKIDGVSYNFEPTTISDEDFYAIIGEPTDPDDETIFIIQGIGSIVVDDDPGIMTIHITNYNGPGTYNIEDVESSLTFSFGVTFSYWGSSSEIPDSSGSVTITESEDVLSGSFSFNTISQIDGTHKNFTEGSFKAYKYNTEY